MPPPAEGLASRLFLGPALRAQPDRRLVTLVREGYETAFEEIVRRYARPLGRYAAAIVGGRSEDVLQDAFAKALPALRRDGAEIDLRPWLFRIVRNTALNDLRDNPPSPELPAEALAGGANPAEELERREELADLMKRLRALPESQRAAIVMRELEGLGHEEIAAALGLSDGGARQAIYRARQALREGAALLLPLPLLRLLIDHGGETAGAGAAGTLAAAGASAGGAGAGGALKLGAIAAIVAGSVGAGVAAQNHSGGAGTGRAAPAAASRARTGSKPAPTPEPAAYAVDSARPRAARAGGKTGPASGGAPAGGNAAAPAGAHRAGRPPGGGRGDFGRPPGERPPRRGPPGGRRGHPGGHLNGRRGPPRGGPPGHPAAGREGAEAAPGGRREDGRGGETRPPGRPRPGHGGPIAGEDSGGSTESSREGESGGSRPSPPPPPRREGSGAAGGGGSAGQAGAPSDGEDGTVESESP